LPHCRPIRMRHARPGEACSCTATPVGGDLGVNGAWQDAGECGRELNTETILQLGDCYRAGYI
jgi:hypothetical protein